jgi:hypothetical protein
MADTYKLAEESNASIFFIKDGGSRFLRKAGALISDNKVQHALKRTLSVFTVVRASFHVSSFLPATLLALRKAKVDTHKQSTAYGQRILAARN